MLSCFFLFLTGMHCHGRVLPKLLGLWGVLHPSKVLHLPSGGEIHTWTHTHPYESSSRAESLSLSLCTVHCELDCAHSIDGVQSYNPLQGVPMHACMHHGHCRSPHSFRLLGLSLQCYFLLFTQLHKSVHELRENYVFWGGAHLLEGRLEHIFRKIPSPHPCHPSL